MVAPAFDTMFVPVQQDGLETDVKDVNKYHILLCALYPDALTLLSQQYNYLHSHMCIIMPEWRKMHWTRYVLV